MIEEIESVLGFWFGSGKTATEVAHEKTALWWGKDDSVDALITNRFAATTAAAANGELDHWRESARGLLGLIICTDQFPRNIHRNTPQAFASDAIALWFAKECVERGAERQLQPIERVFAYLPFEHSEELAEQQRALALYQALAQNVDPNETELFNKCLDFAHQHHRIIKRFGRFPHRNSILGRHSNDEELAFLKQPDSSF